LALNLALTANLMLEPKPVCLELGTRLALSIALKPVVGVVLGIGLVLTISLKLSVASYRVLN
jgi:hypothetical protein